MLWKKIRRAVTQNRFFESLDKLKYQLKIYWKQFSLTNPELLAMQRKWVYFCQRNTNSHYSPYKQLKL